MQSMLDPYVGAWGTGDQEQVLTGPAENTYPAKMWISLSLILIPSACLGSSVFLAS